MDEQPRQPPRAAPDEDHAMNSVLQRNITALRARKAQAEREAGWSERIADAVTRFAGSMGFVWMHALAVGAWTLNHDARRPLVVLACVFGFLGFWLAMLAARRRRLAGRE